MSQLAKMSSLISDCIDQGFLVPMTPGIFVTLAARRTAKAAGNRKSTSELRHHEFFIGTYGDLKDFKSLVLAIGRAVD